MAFFSDFQHGFMSSQSSSDLLTVVPDRTDISINRSGTNQAVAFDISKAFNNSVWHTDLLHNLKPGIWPYFVFSQ